MYHLPGEIKQNKLFSNVLKLNTQYKQQNLPYNYQMHFLFENGKKPNTLYMIKWMWHSWIVKTWA